MSKFAVRLSAILPLILLMSCELLPEGLTPSIKSVTPRIAGIDFQGVDLAFDVDVSNPYPVALRSPRFRYGFSIEQTPFLSQQEVPGVDLPAGNVGTASLPIRLNYLEVGRLIGRLAGVNQASYTLDGAFLINILGRDYELPLSHSSTFPILQRPEISVVSFQPSEISLSRTKVGVEANIKNPNVFGIGVKDLGYVLRIGDITIGNLTVSTPSEIGAGQTGKLSLTGEITALDGIRGLISGLSPGAVKIQPSGAIQTPYGSVELPALFD